MRSPVIRRTVLAALATLAVLARLQAAEPEVPPLGDAPAVPLGAVEEAALSPPSFRGHAIAMHGRPKYPADFPYFDYVNPTAPKGGEIRFAANGTFDNFNAYIPKGNAVAGLHFLNETLLTGSADEAFTQYGLLAEEIVWPKDRSWVIFKLRPEARWHDGKPVTPEDVIFSLDLLKDILRDRAKVMAFVGRRIWVGESGPTLYSDTTRGGPGDLRAMGFPPFESLEMPIVQITASATALPDPSST